MPIMITLTDIKRHHPCSEGWSNLVNGRRALFPDWRPADPFPMVECLQTNTFNDVLWAAQCLPEHEVLWRLFALWCLGQAFREVPRSEHTEYLQGKMIDLTWILEGGVPKYHREIVRDVLVAYQKNHLPIVSACVPEVCLLRGMIAATYEAPQQWGSPVSWAVSAICRVRWPEWGDLTHLEHLQRIKIINDQFQDKLSALLESPESVTHMHGTREYVESAA